MLAAGCKGKGKGGFHSHPPMTGGSTVFPLKVLRHVAPAAALMVPGVLENGPLGESEQSDHLDLDQTPLRGDGEYPLGGGDDGGRQGGLCQAPFRETSAVVRGLVTTETANPASTEAGHAWHGRWDLHPGT